MAWLLGAFGSEALLPPGMHYRWSYRAEQEAFLRAEFGRLRYSGPDRAARDDAGRQLMDYFNGFLPLLGVTEATIPTVERAYLELLEALDQHFQQWPYLLGGRPSIADFGFMAPLFAHLARDPVPATLMKNRAPERVQLDRAHEPRRRLPTGNFRVMPESFPADDAIPESLDPVLRLVFQDWGPQLLADAAHYNAWVGTRPVDAGRPRWFRPAGERKVHPTLGYDRVPVAWLHHAPRQRAAWAVALRQGRRVRACTATAMRVRVSTRWSSALVARR